MTDPQVHGLIIVGGGPAGYTAATYAARADLDPLVFEGYAWGGLLQQTTEVENYPGFPAGIMGPDLMSAMRGQAQRFGARLETEDVTEVKLSDDGPHSVLTYEGEYRADAVIFATGSEPLKPGVPGELELTGRGVSYCATCDGAFFRDKRVAVIGGGDSAMEEAMFLATFASEVLLVHRRDQFRASRVMAARALATANITALTPYVLDGLTAGENGSLDHATLRHALTGEIRSEPLDGCFIAIGHRPNSQLLDGQLELDDQGYVLVEGRSTRTTRPGVFACGDLIDPIYRQAVTAAGSGCQAALDAERYLRGIG